MGRLLWGNNGLGMAAPPPPAVAAAAAAAAAPPPPPPPPTASETESALPSVAPSTNPPADSVSAANNVTASSGSGRQHSREPQTLVYAAAGQPPSSFHTDASTSTTSSSDEATAEQELRKSASDEVVTTKVKLVSRRGMLFVSASSKDNNDDQGETTVEEKKKMLACDTRQDGDDLEEMVVSTAKTVVTETKELEAVAKKIPEDQLQQVLPSPSLSQLQQGKIRVRHGSGAGACAGAAPSAGGSAGAGSGRCGGSVVPRASRTSSVPGAHPVVATVPFPRCSNNNGGANSNETDRQASQNDVENPPASETTNSVSALSASVMAHLVTDEEDAEKLRQRLQEIQNAPTAMVVDKNKKGKRMMMIIFLCLLVIVGIIAVILGAMGVFTKGNNDTTATTNNAVDSTKNKQPLFLKPTLQTIQERGYIRCRVIPEQHDSGKISQVLCRALSAAIFGGNPNRTEFITMPIAQLWSSIDNGTVDIATSWNTGTMNRDVFETNSGQPKSFSPGYFITGTQVAGPNEFVSCVDHADTITGVCKDLMICVAQDTTTFDVISNHMDGSGLHPVLQLADLYSGLANGTCNVMAGEPQYMSEDRARNAGYLGEYVFGSSLLSTEPQSMTTRENDPQWTDFSSSVIQALFTAELENITRENATLFPETNLFGERYKFMYQNVVAAVGNWGDIYQQTFAEYIERNAVNKVNKNLGEGGLLYAPPLGTLQYSPKPHYTNPPGAVVTLEAITNKGRVRCGIIPNRPGFVMQQQNTTTPNHTSTEEWIGMDIDLCCCLASALFRDHSRVDFVVLQDDVSGFMALAEDLVDVVAGVAYTLQADIMEATTNRGYTFSPIYFYGEEPGERLAIVTNQNATQWSDFVRWTIYGLINAEEQGIQKADASKMPSVDLFGPAYTLMFRLIVLTFGNYGELYEKNLQWLIPRQGSNLLNDGSTPLLNPLPLDQFIGGV